MLLSFLIAIGTTISSCSALPSPPRNAALPNDNRFRAGTLQRGVLTARIVARRAAWRPDGPSGCALGVHAFAEEGKPATIPGPLIRVRPGTQVRVIVRNALSTPLWVRGLQDRAAGNTLDSTEVRPGQLRVPVCRSDARRVALLGWGRRGARSNVRRRRAARWRAGRGFAERRCEIAGGPCARVDAVEPDRVAEQRGLSAERV